MAQRDILQPVIPKPLFQQPIVPVVPQPVISKPIVPIIKPIVPVIKPIVPVIKPIITEVPQPIVPAVPQPIVPVVPQLAIKPLVPRPAIQPVVPIVPQPAIQPVVPVVPQPAIQPLVSQPAIQPLVPQPVIQPLVPQPAIQPLVPQIAIQPLVPQPAIQPVVPIVPQPAIQPTVPVVSPKNTQSIPSGVVQLTISNACDEMGYGILMTFHNKYILADRIFNNGRDTIIHLYSTHQITYDGFRFLMEIIDLFEQRFDKFIKDITEKRIFFEKSGFGKPPRKLITPQDWGEAIAELIDLVNVYKRDLQIHIDIRRNPSNLKEECKKMPLSQCGPPCEIKKPFFRKSYCSYK